MTDIFTLQTQLTEAEQARHRLLTGTQEVTVSLQGLGTATYSQANIEALERYIADLRGQIARLNGGPRRGIIRTVF